ncbi:MULTISPECIES: hypothetical protein [unclassified Cellulophaga]|uniref:hypothetical protein n=1 Tax=unclassified Cellulophaga TaxID=2634405 RepID=UPI0026E360D4|nr:MULTISPECIES: hypothetical protein [unclassified Cellulophaga]MDO6490548.1 hypothetical protein [Cellulophaga sp. 2_MG-2023]MDO6494258.1 hypothetical protein [Cellulophaga sp. 3_MG-2023]
MKKFKILFILPIFVLFSCNEDDSEITNYDLGANIILNTNSISNLDVNNTMEISIITADGVSVSSIQVIKGDDNVDASISGNTATFNSSLLGTLIGQEEDGIDINTITTLSNEKPYTKSFNINITKALAFDKELDAITYNTTVEDTLSFSASTKSAIIDNISLEWKKGSEGTYASTEPLGAALNVDGEEIIFSNFTDASYGYNLAVKDTLYYRFIATSGSLKDTIITSMPIISQTFENSNAVVLSSDITKNKLNLDTATSYTDSETELAEIKFKSPSGFEKAGSTDIDFVKVGDLSGESEYYNTVEKLFSEKDLLVAKRLYEAGAKETEFSSTAQGDLYIYKVTRLNEDGDSITEYGMIKIGDIITTNGGTTLTDINIEFGEGEIK